jgi:Xaa-Pro aminopeptidase
MKHKILNKNIFISNRTAFTKKMQANSIAIFNSNDKMPANGDALHSFKQNSDLYWLTGITQEDTMLILYPNNASKSHREILVLLRPNEEREKWDGKLLRTQEAASISGIETIVWNDGIESLLQAYIHAVDAIYLNTNENDRKSTTITTKDYAYIAEIKKKYPLHRLERSAKIMRELRAIKSALEIEVVQEAINITANAFHRVLQFVKPGIKEYEIEAEILHEFIKRGATGPAYSSIIASGDNARILHYVDNNQVCKNGDLILMDFGAEYGGYCADLTRTIPVSGVFSKRQKEVYDACLHLHNYAKSILKPGISIVDYTNKVGTEANKQFVKIGLLSASEIKNNGKEQPAYRRYLYHGISHHLGIDVHDVGSRTTPVQPGMLFTIEPGIYIEEEKMGVRIENNVWITKTGNKDLMKNIPITTADIETVMKQSKKKLLVK